MIFTGNPLIIKPGMVFFMYMILMDSEAQLTMNLGETYLVTEDGNEIFNISVSRLLITFNYEKIFCNYIFWLTMV
jgi:Xaa-Pro dipeptidase